MQIGLLTKKLAQSPFSPLCIVCVRPTPDIFFWNSPDKRCPTNLDRTPVIWNSPGKRCPNDLDRTPVIWNSSGRKPPNFQNFPELSGSSAGYTTWKPLNQGLFQVEPFPDKAPSYPDDPSMIHVKPMIQIEDLSRSKPGSSRSRPCFRFAPFPDRGMI